MCRGIFILNTNHNISSEPIHFLQTGASTNYRFPIKSSLQVNTWEFENLYKSKLAEGLICIILETQYYQFIGKKNLNLIFKNSQIPEKEIGFWSFILPGPLHQSIKTFSQRCCFCCFYNWEISYRALLLYFYKFNN